MSVGFLLLLLAAAVALLCLERVPVDVVALGLLVALLLTGTLDAGEALSGFGSEVVISLGGLFVLTAGLRLSGSLEALAGASQRLAASRPRHALALFLLTVAAVSAFVNNTAATAVFLPFALALSRGSGIAPSKILMPTAFASILGGSMTLVGTSTNVIVSGLLAASGEAPLGMFELLPVALPIAVAGLAFLALAAPRLLPEGRAPELAEEYEIRDHLDEIPARPGSPWVGRAAAELDLGRRPQTLRAPWAVWLAPAVFAAVLALAAAGVLTLASAVLLGCLVLVVSRCLTAEEAYAAVDGRLLLLIAAMLAVGRAMETTGAAEALSRHFMGFGGGLGALGLLAAFYLLTLVLTQPMSNQAAALVVLPLALEVTAEAGIPPRAMAVTVALAASSSFLTPLEPSCLLVYGPGGYRFRDYPRLGLGPTLISLLLTLLLVPLLWPLGD